MTLNQFQKATIGKLTDLHDRLNKVMNPKTEDFRCVITMEVDVKVIIEEPEEETNFKGQLEYHFDREAFNRDANIKIEEQVEYMIANKIRRERIE